MRSSSVNSRNSRTYSTTNRDSISSLRDHLNTGDRKISITSNRPATILLEVDHLLNPDHHQEAGTTCCGLYVSGNSKTLLISTFLFLSITIAQYFAAIIANSQALKADCVSMLVDGLSYIGNLMAECAIRKRTKKRLELTMSGISLSILLGFTTSFLLEPINAIQAVACNCTTDEVTGEETCISDDSKAQECVPEEAVNPYIVMSFALGGLVFDGLSLFAYKQYSKEDCGDKSAHSTKVATGELLDDDNAGGAAAAQDGHNHNHHHGQSHNYHHHFGDHPLTHQHNDDENHVVPTEINVNMLSALMHVFSDLLRSSTTLVEAIVLLQYPSISSNVIDGWCTLIIYSLIGIGTIWSILIWITEVWGFLTSDEEEEDEEDCKYMYEEIY
jgi:Co/Zn/Cd efflux system component